MTEYRTGQLLELHTPAHPYYDARVGWIDRSYTVPAETRRMQIARVTRRPDGDVRLLLRPMDGLWGFAIIVDRWLAYGPNGGWGRTLKVVEGWPQ